MASFVTHYFLGKEIQDHFSPKLKELIQGQENLYLLGNQGPDLFFFQISKQVKGEKNLGTLLHDRPFRSLLEDLKKFQPHLAQKPRSLAYFLGLCNHFFVDASIHPTVNALARPGFDHISIEGELDRYFIKKNGQDLNGFRQSDLFAPSYDLRAILAIYQGFGATLSDIPTPGTLAGKNPLGDFENRQTRPVLWQPAGAPSPPSPGRKNQPGPGGYPKRLSPKSCRLYRDYLSLADRRFPPTRPGRPRF